MKIVSEYHIIDIGGWHRWLSKEDNPRDNSDVIIRKENGDIYFAKYAMGTCLLLQCKIEFDEARSVILIDSFYTGDEWIYLDQVRPVKKEPISEDLKKAASEYASRAVFAEDDPYEYIIATVFEDGAKWQKIEDSEEIKLIRGLLEDFDKHCDEYHEAGFKHGQEALMKDAISGVADYQMIGHDFPNIHFNHKEFKDYLDGKGIKDDDEVKVIITKKED